MSLQIFSNSLTFILSSLKMINVLAVKYLFAVSSTVHVIKPGLIPAFKHLGHINHCRPCLDAHVSTSIHMCWGTNPPQHTWIEMDT